MYTPDVTLDSEQGIQLVVVRALLLLMLKKMAELPVSDIKDEVLRNASLEASKSNCILPLLKLEIRCKIEKKLLEKGEDVINVPKSSPSKKRKTEVVYNIFLYEWDFTKSLKCQCGKIRNEKL